MMLDDMVTWLTSHSVGTFGQTVFKSSKADVPSLNVPTLQVRYSGGAPPINTQNSAPRPARELDGFQLVARGPNVTQTEAFLRSGYDALVLIQNMQIGSTWYVKVRPTTGLVEMGTDDNNQIQMLYNFLVEYSR